MGFVPVAETLSRFPDQEVPATRYEKAVFGRLAFRGSVGDVN
jgi:hypothetical protein